MQSVIGRAGSIHQSSGRPSPQPVFNPFEPNLSPPLGLQEDIMKKLLMLSPLVVLFVALVVPVSAQQNAGSSQSAASTTQITSGAKMKIKGMILKREDQGFRLRDQ